MERLWSGVKHLLRHPCGIFPGAPRGIISDARVWIDRQRRREPVDIRRGPGSWYWEYELPTLRPLPAPRSAHPTETCPPAWRVMVAGGTALFRLIDSRVLGQEGTVISSDNRVFAEFTYVDQPGGIDSHPIFRRRRFPKAISLSGTYATLVYPSAFAYYHWVAESLPRLKLLEPCVAALDGIFVPGAMEAQMRESLRYFGVRDEQLIALDMGSHYRPQTLLVPKYCNGLNIPEWVPAYLKARVLNETTNRPLGRRLFISRADAAKRRLLNEPELHPMLREKGFEIVQLRDLSFRQQAELFNAAEVIIGPHGAGLANLVFARAGVKVLELVPCPRVGPHLYYSIATAVGGEYWWLTGRPLENPGDACIHSHFRIEPADLEYALGESCLGL
jgi:capsular polysaccharide biosynthesis protein